MGDTITTCLVLIPALPLAAAVIVALLGAKVLRGYSHWPVVVALAASFVFSAILWREVSLQQENANEAGFERIVTLWTWASISDAYDLVQNPPAVQPGDAGSRDLAIDVALRADALTAMMLAMVTFVASLVAVYASGYMHGDRGYWRFFAYIGLFVFSMTMLVSVSNFVLLFVFWEAVGVCSYLLIGFWYPKPEAAAAGKKAFLVNRVGDFAFTVAMFLIWTTYGTLNYHDAPGAQSATVAELATVRESPNSGEFGYDSGIIRGVLAPSRIVPNDYATGTVATAICLLLLLGACGKSAQFPLHVWLADAMEGPTPVSALIHAATMVTAGVYMVARCSPLFFASPTAQLVVACVGAFTALLAALIALTQFDLKRILAYSTISQLGFMFLALGAGTFAGVTGGMFHLFTHAFFKALLFLGAGSVMHAMGGVIDIREFRGLRKLMPWTHATFLVGGLALAGVLPLAGFWSKDAILAAVHDKVHALDHELEHRHAAHNAEAENPAEEAAAAAAPLAAWNESHLATSRTVYQWLYYAAVFTAFLTAFYTFRALALTFYGDERIPAAAGNHAHESPAIMVAPLVVLAVCSVVVGVIAFAGNRLVGFLSHTPSLAGGAVAATYAPPEFHLNVAGISTVVALLGIGLALYLYAGEPTEARFLKRLLDLEGVDRLTDPQWVTQLERVGWIGATTRFLRSVHLGWLVTAVGYVLGTLSLVLAVPLIVGKLITPYRLSRDKFYLDEIYAALVVWPLRILASVFYWIDRWVIDGLVDAVGRVPTAGGWLMRSLQMGLVQFYALAMVLGVLILVAARLMWAG